MADAIGQVNDLFVECKDLNKPCHLAKFKAPSTNLLDSNGKFLASSTLHVFPNPATTKAHLSFVAPGFEGRVKIEVFNHLGQKVWVRSFGAIREVLETDISLGEWAEGWYQVRLSCRGGFLHKTLYVN